MEETRDNSPHRASGSLKTGHEGPFAEKSPSSVREEGSGSSPETSPETGKSKSKSKQYPNKPVIERQRRARMNEHLSELKLLIMQELREQPGRLSKLDKAELLELAVRHLKRTAVSKGTNQDPYQHGYSECAWTVQQFLASSTQVDPDLRIRIINHLAGRMHQSLETGALSQATPSLFPPTSLPSLSLPDQNSNLPTTSVNIGQTNSLWHVIHNPQIKKETSGNSCSHVPKIDVQSRGESLTDCLSSSNVVVSSRTVPGTSPTSKPFLDIETGGLRARVTMQRPVNPVPILPFTGREVMMGWVPGWGQPSFRSANSSRTDVSGMNPTDPRTQLRDNCDMNN